MKKAMELWSNVAVQFLIPSAVNQKAGAAMWNESSL